MTQNAPQPVVTPPNYRRSFRQKHLWWWRGVAVVGSAIGVLLVTEIVFRVFSLGPTVYVPRRFEPNGRVPFVQIPNGPIAYQSNTTFTSVYDTAGDIRGYFGPDGRIRYRINQYGMRGPAVALEKPAGGYRVVCLGDSLIFGEGVKQADTFPAQLQDQLAAALPERRVEVLNAGVQAYGTADEAAFYLLRCAAFHPDVVTLGFFLNDATGREVTIRQNEEWTSDIKLSPMSQLSRLYEILERSAYARKWQEDYFQTTRESFRSKGWTDCKDILKGMKVVSREDGFRFVVIVFPILWETGGRYPFEDIHKTINSFCHEAGIECIDLLDVYRGQPAASLWVHPTDHHPNEIAHRLAADRVARSLMGSGS